MKIVPLTQEHLLKVEGEIPEITVKGLALVDEDEVLAVLCMSVLMEDNFVFCHVSEKADKRKLIEGWRQFVSQMDGEYYAVMDEDLSTAPGFLKHFGFEPLLDNIYVYRG